MCEYFPISDESIRERVRSKQTRTYMYRIYSTTKTIHYGALNKKIYRSDGTMCTVMKQRKELSTYVLYLHAFAQDGCSSGIPTGMPMSMPGTKAGH